MIHFFILFPMLVTLGIVMIQMCRKRPGEVIYYYLRNFFIIWSICTLFIGAAETFFGTPYAKSMALAIAVPFLYVASAFLIKLPFALFKKGLVLANLLAVVVVLMGVLFGLTTFFQANKLVSSLGPLQELFAHLASRLSFYRIWSTLLIFVPVGVFFLFDVLKKQLLVDRLSALLIGSGLIVAGVSEWFHIQAKHAAGADFYTVFGFLLVVAGLSYPLLFKTTSTTTS